MQTVSDQTFQDLVRENTDPTVVYFTGSWCKPCQTFGPMLDNIAEKFSGDVRFLKADMDENEITAGELNIRSLPSLVLFDGGMVRDVQSGTMTPEQVRLWIQESI